MPRLEAGVQGSRAAAPELRDGHGAFKSCSSRRTSAAAEADPALKKTIAENAKVQLRTILRRLKL